VVHEPSWKRSGSHAEGSCSFQSSFMLMCDDGPKESDFNQNRGVREFVCICMQWLVVIPVFHLIHFAQSISYALATLVRVRHPPPPEKMGATVQILYNRPGKWCKWCTPYTCRFNNLRAINEGICSTPTASTKFFRSPERSAGSLFPSHFLMPACDLY
jgi:hypothetical protein